MLMFVARMRNYSNTTFYTKSAAVLQCCAAPGFSIDSMFRLGLRTESCTHLTLCLAHCSYRGNKEPEGSQANSFITISLTLSPAQLLLTGLGGENRANQNQFLSMLCSLSNLFVSIQSCRRKNNSEFSLDYALE